MLLAVQADVAYPHYRHLDRDELVAEIGSRAALVEVRVTRSDAPQSFDEFFSGFERFVSQSNHPTYWWRELERLRVQFKGAPLCEDDTLTVLATTRESTKHPTIG